MYQLSFTPKAIEALERAKGKIRKQLEKALERVQKDPFLSKPLRDELAGLNSERVATYRIIFRIIKEKKEVRIILIEHRKSVYGGH